MSIRNQTLCAWSGLVFLALFGLGLLVIARFIPPTDPAATADQVAALYREHALAIRSGLGICQFSLIFFPPWVSVISTQMRRIEGPNPVMASTQLLGGGLAMLAILLPAMIWATVSFRLDRNPELMLLLNDLGWLILTMVFAPFVTQNLAIALAILGDRRAKPVFPRWAGFYNFFVGLLFVPIGLIVFFKSGPFAWNGVIGFWIPVADFAIWFGVMFKLLRDAIGQQAAEERTTPA